MERQIGPRSTAEDGVVRPRVEERISRSDNIGILRGGGTILSLTREGVRVGGYDDPLFPHLSSHFPEGGYTYIPTEYPIFDGLSEDLTYEDFDRIEVKIARAINDKRSCDRFLFFVGSDMCEAIGLGLAESMMGELAQNRVRIFLVWANEPIPHLEAIRQCRRALIATTENFEGGIYVISGNSVIPALHAAKQSWSGGPMRFYDTSDPQSITTENARRRTYADLTDMLSQQFFHMDFLQAINYMGGSLDNMIATHPEGKRVWQTFLPGPTTRDRRRLRLEDLRTSPTAHPIDASGQIIVKQLNSPSSYLTESELANCKALLVVLNHSATTRKDFAQTLVTICQKRREAGRPLLVFAVTETGEPRQWSVEEGLYPSGALLRHYVFLIPGHVKPTLLKLWAGVHNFGFEFPQLIEFMYTNFFGEVVGDIYRKNIERATSNLRIT